MGTPEGAAKARAKALAKNPDHIREMSSKGGKSVKPSNRAFARNRKLASRAGKIGGSNSHRR